MKNSTFLLLGALISLLVLGSVSASATSQWTRKTGLSCTACHTVFPRLNDFGQQFQLDGYVLKAKKASEAVDDEDEVFIEKINNLLGFRLNLTPIGITTNALVKPGETERQTQVTIGNANWIQFFVAGSIFTDVAFFSELEYTSSAFKFNWFYFNFTNLFGSKLVNFNVGNTTPILWASYPDRLPQLPNIKGEVFAQKAAGGVGDNATDMRSARMSIAWFANLDVAKIYAGVTPGTSGIQTKPDQKLQYWAGLVLRLPDDVIDGFEGSTATIHYYQGTSTKNAADTLPTIENGFTRISPQLNLRWNDHIDLQFAYVMASDDNYFYSTAADPEPFKYSGMALDLGYMPNEDWHFGVHYDNYSSDKKVETAENPWFDYSRIVPVVTYVINQNIRFSAYYEMMLNQTNSGVAVADDIMSDKIYINMRAMF